MAKEKFRIESRDDYAGEDFEFGEWEKYFIKDELIFDSRKAAEKWIEKEMEWDARNCMYLHTEYRIVSV